MNILITGGASGLGAAITAHLASSPANTIYFTFNRSGADAKAIEQKFPNTKSIFCNYEDETSVASLLEEIENKKIEVLVNNAFTGLQTNYFHKTDPAYFSDNFIKNIIPVIKLTQSAILYFRKQKSGKIITILTSYIINDPPSGLSEYVAAKNYLLSLSKSWAVENSKFNITSNCISPSFMQTKLTENTDERVIEEIIKAHPLKRLLTPAEVAEAVQYFIEPSNKLNGTNLVINSAADIK